jgi:hypothetical protein
VNLVGDRLWQIDSTIGLADPIMAVDGIDIGWLGHFDLTNSMGIPGQFEHPDFLSAVDRLIAAAAPMASPPESLPGLSRPPRRGGRAAFAPSPMGPTSRCCSRAYGLGWFDYERARVDD